MRSIKGEKTEILGKVKRMNSCEEHIEVVIDMFVDEKEIAPNIQKIEVNHNLSTTCELCEKPAVYIVSE